jgi:hypothetical protein
LHFALAQRTGKLEQPIRKGGLTVVDVRDDAEIPDVLGIHGLLCFSAGAANGVLHEFAASFEPLSLPQVSAPRQRGLALV